MDDYMLFLFLSPNFRLVLISTGRRILCNLTHLTCTSQSQRDCGVSHHPRERHRCEAHLQVGKGWPNIQPHRTSPHPHPHMGSLPQVTHLSLSRATTTRKEACAWTHGHVSVLNQTRDGVCACTQRPCGVCVKHHKYIYITPPLSSLSISTTVHHAVCLM
jgi:hypothetical protein